MAEPAGIEACEHLRERKPLSGVMLQGLLKIPPETALVAVVQPTASVENVVKSSQLLSLGFVGLAADEFCVESTANGVHRSSPSDVSSCVLPDKSIVA